MDETGLTVQEACEAITLYDARHRLARALPEAADESLGAIEAHFLAA